jgi:hypothetical protein
VEVALAGDVVLVDHHDVTGIGGIDRQAGDVVTPEWVGAGAELGVVSDPPRHARPLGRRSHQDQQAAQAEAERRRPQESALHQSPSLVRPGTRRRRLESAQLRKLVSR